MGQTPPYRTPNRYITSASELLALPGFGHDRYVALAPYVTALPYNTKLNVCTAKGPVLDAFLGHGDFSSDPQGLSKNRAAATGCFPTLTDYEAAADPATLKNIKSRLQMTSSYFRLTSLITIGSTEFNLYSLLLQDSTTGQVRPVLRSYTPD
jgi:type II secretory pathway component PulK